MVVADVQGAGARGNLDHRVGRMIGAEDVVQIALPQMAIVDLRRDA